MSGEGQPQTTVQTKRKVQVRKVGLIITAAVVIFFLLAVLGGLTMVKQLALPVDVGDTVSIKVNIPEGISTSEISTILVKNGLIKNARFFRGYVRFKKLDTSLKSGEYVLSPAMSLEEIVEKLTQGGEIVTYKFTVPEGLTAEQTAQLWENKGFGDKQSFIEAAVNTNWDYWFLEGLPAGESLEGFLLPETYNIPNDMNARDMVGMMLSELEKFFNNEQKSRLEQSGFSVYEILTLASIVEKEAKLDEERVQVSAVFLNRLRIGMPLQSCATIQYILGEPKPVLLDEDLKIPSPFNTYLHPGLPPGPIASPGKASLDATLNPAEVDYLYFVTKGDGSHAFAKTLREHNNNKRKYLK